MNEPFETNDRRMPYEFSEAAFEALHARIGRRLDAVARAVLHSCREERPGLRRIAARPLLRWGIAAAGAAVVVAGVVLALRLQRPAADGHSDFNGLLSTAPAETLQQAAAENYDDILFNQQL